MPPVLVLSVILHLWEFFQALAPLGLQENVWNESLQICFKFSTHGTESQLKELTGMQWKQLEKNIMTLATIKQNVTGWNWVLRNRTE